MENNTDTNWLERTVSIIAVVLVTFTFGFLIYNIINEDNSPPDIRINFGEPRKKDEGYSIPIMVKNEGAQTAKDIVIEISLKDDPDEKGQVTFDFLPGKSSRKGWIPLSKHPTPENLKPRVLGYSIP